MIQLSFFFEKRSIARYDGQEAFFFFFFFFSKLLREAKETIILCFPIDRTNGSRG